MVSASRGAIQLLPCGCAEVVPDGASARAAGPKLSTEEGGGAERCGPRRGTVPQAVHERGSTALRGAWACATGCGGPPLHDPRKRPVRWAPSTADRLVVVRRPCRFLLGGPCRRSADGSIRRSQPGPVLCTRGGFPGTCTSSSTSSNAPGPGRGPAPVLRRVPSAVPGPRCSPCLFALCAGDAPCRSAYTGRHRHRPGHHRRAAGRTAHRPFAGTGPVEPAGTSPSSLRNKGTPRADPSAGTRRQPRWYRATDLRVGSVLGRRDVASRRPLSFFGGPSSWSTRSAETPLVPSPNLPSLENAIQEFWRSRRHLPCLDRTARGRGGVRLLRRTSLRQRPAALRSPADRLRQGRHPALPHHVRQQGGPPLRLGHPWPARRARGDEGTRDDREVRDRGDGREGVQQRRPGLGAEVHQGVGGLRHPPGPLGRLRERLQDPRRHLHGIGAVGVQDPLRQGPGVRGLLRAALLLEGSDAAVRARAADGRRRLSRSARTRPSRSPSRSPGRRPSSWVWTG